MNWKRTGTAAAAGILIASVYAAPISIYALGNPYSGGWSNCTWSAWELAAAAGYLLPSLGNAGSWYANAAALGMSVGQEPRANSIVVYSNHVGYVNDFDGTNIYVLEGGYSGGFLEGWWNGYSGGRSQSLIGYIYLDGYTGYNDDPAYTDTIDGAYDVVSVKTDSIRAKIEDAVTYSNDTKEKLASEQNNVVFQATQQENLKADEQQAAQQYQSEVRTGKVVTKTDSAQ